jgi:hypothetical protein
LHDHSHAQDHPLINPARKPHAHRGCERMWWESWQTMRRSDAGESLRDSPTRSNGTQSAPGKRVRRERMHGRGCAG